MLKEERLSIEQAARASNSIYYFLKDEVALNIKLTGVSTPCAQRVSPQEWFLYYDPFRVFTASRLLFYARPAKVLELPNEPSIERHGIIQVYAQHKCVCSALFHM